MRSLVTTILLSINFVAITCGPFLRTVAFAQEPATKTRTRVIGSNSPDAGPNASKPSDPTPGQQPAGEQAESKRKEMKSEEEAAIEPFYNNFFLNYRLGPEDVISVVVFGHERYSRAGVVIPPNGRITLPLIPEGVFVNGKTVEEVAEAVRKRYDEYIIDPKVDVSLDKAVSYRYSVIGDVAQPGIKLMTRRLTVREALAEAGGVLATGNKSKVAILRRQSDGMLGAIPVNMSKVEQGKIADDVYLAPGDQVIVPGNTLKKIQTILNLVPILGFARIFGF